MDMNESTMQRIFEAADTLHAEGGRSKFPTVDAVRKLAKVNMNDAQEGMKEWRRRQKMSPGLVSQQIPEDLHAPFIAALAPMWRAASARASEALRVTQAAWEAERAQDELVHKEALAGFDEQTAALEAATHELSNLRAQLSTVRSDLAAVLAARDEAQRERAEWMSLARDAGIRNEELNRRNADLNHALEEERAGFSSALTVLTDQMEQLRTLARQDIEKAQTSLTLAQQESAELPDRLAHVTPVAEESASSRRRKGARSETPGQLELPAE